MKSSIKVLAAIALAVGLSAASAQSLSISPSGSVRINANDPDSGNRGQSNAPGQLKKEYGGSAKDYASGQQNKDQGDRWFDDKSNSSKAKSNSNGKGKNK